MVFTGPRGDPIRRSNFNPLVGWLEAVEAIGAPGLHFHDLRHTGNTLAAATGVSMRDLTPGGGLPLGRKLPTSKTSGVPRLDARYLDNGRSLGHVEITNHGPGDVYDLDVTAEEKEGLLVRGAGELPVAKLPAGKSVRVMRARSMGSGGGSYFNVTVTGKTVDGLPIEQEIFVSGA